MVLPYRLLHGVQMMLYLVFLFTCPFFIQLWIRFMICLQKCQFYTQYLLDILSYTCKHHFLRGLVTPLIATVTVSLDFFQLIPLNLGNLI